MKNKNILTHIFIAVILFGCIIISSCKDDSNPSAPPPPVTSNLVKMDSGYVPGAKAIMSFYSEDSLKLGYNKVYIVLYDSVTNVLITDAHIEFLPFNHGHYAPVENPDEEAVDGKFPGAMVLTQAFPNGDVHWRFNFKVHNHQTQGEPQGQVEFEIPRILDNLQRFKSIIMPDSTKLYLSYISPKSPVNGLNAFEFLISRNEPELFPPDGSFTIQMNPVFLADGHTTTGNINPTGTTDGHYKGKFNLDRSGNWRINLKLIKNTLSYDTFFEIEY